MGQFTRVGSATTDVIATGGVITQVDVQSRCSAVTIVEQGQ